MALTLFLTLALILIITALLAVGYLIRGKALRSSCCGMGPKLCQKNDSSCGIDPPQKREKP